MRWPSLRKSERGFTLIELLVVCAIIGVLAAMVMVSLSYTRARANDTRVRASMNQFRNMAEIYYSSQNSSYLGFDTCIAFPTSGNCITQPIADAILQLRNDVEFHNDDPGSVEAESDVRDFCVSAPLRTTPTTFVCVESSGAILDTANPCGGTTFVCN